MTTDTLTGRQRLRAHESWGKVLLVLEVEVEGERCGGVRNPTRHVVRFWRDARVEDLTDGIAVLGPVHS
jgi:hypothetical protein